MSKHDVGNLMKLSELFPPEEVTTEQRRGTRFGRASVGASQRSIGRERSEFVPAWEELSGTHRLPEGAGHRGYLQRDVVLRRALAVADLFGASVALVFAVIVLGHGSLNLRPSAVLIAPFVVVVSKAIGLYDRDQHTLRKSTIDELPSILYLSVSYSLAVWLAETLLISGWLARPQVFGLAVASFVFVATCRSLARHAALAVTPVERCIVIGNVANATRMASKLHDAASVKATVVGLVQMHAGDTSQVRAVPTLGDADALARIVAEYDVDRAIIAPGSDDNEDTLHMVRLLQVLGVKVSVLPRLLEAVGSSSTFDEVDGITLLGVRQYGLSRSSALLKRSLDLVAASLGVALLLPLFFLVALLIKIDSRGPVLFRQPRIGCGGRRFDMFKLRSMVRDADRIKEELRRSNEARGGLFKISGDPRITRVGRLLRQTSLDELPQLLNVVMGHMSLVGPRPLVPDEDAMIEGWERRRLAMKPGMTGLWQIYGSARIPMQEMVKIDYLYGANWSVWLDIKILLRTVAYVVARKGM